MKEVEKYYDNFSYPKINLYTNRQRKRHDKLIKNILKIGKIDLKNLKDKKVLDAGCGTGEKSVFLAKNKALVTGIDLSKEQINCSKSLALKNNLKIDFLKKDIVNDSFSSFKKYDIILCTGVLHHTENPYKGFLNLLSVLKKDGIIIIALYHKYARIRYRFIRFLLHNFISRDSKKLEYAFNNYSILKPLKKAPKNSIYDRYLVPYESYHTLKEVKEWFSKNNIETLSFSKEFKGYEPLKIFEKKTLFFISGIKK